MVLVVVVVTAVATMIGPVTVMYVGWRMISAPMVMSTCIRVFQV